ncbi:transposase, partial [Nitrococcus mobilis]
MRRSGAYLGNEGWCIGLELREGRCHSAQGTDEVLARVLPRAGRLTDAALLVRMDSDFDSGKLFGAIAEASAERQRGGGAPIEVLIKWNPRGGGAETIIERALGDITLVWRHPREGKRTAVFEDTLERRGHNGTVIRLRRVLALTERTIDRHGQHLITAKYDLADFLTTLDAKTVDAETIIALYCDHGTHEQFHSELKTDLDLERLPSGKFANNDL